MKLDRITNKNSPAYKMGARFSRPEETGVIAPRWFYYRNEKAAIENRPLFIVESKRSKRAGTAFKINPSAPPRQVAQAARRFKSFTGRAPDRVEKIPMDPLPKVGLAFGELLEIGYLSYRDGLPYRHSFRPLRSRPLVVSTPDGKRLLLIGGSYSFTERGIVNK